MPLMAAYSNLLVRCSAPLPCNSFTTSKSDRSVTDLVSATAEILASVVFVGVFSAMAHSSPTPVKVGVRGRQSRLPQQNSHKKKKNGLLGFSRQERGTRHESLDTNALALSAVGRTIQLKCLVSCTFDDMCCLYKSYYIATCLAPFLLEALEVCRPCQEGSMGPRGRHRPGPSCGRGQREPRRE